MYIALPVKYLLFLSDFNETRICLTYFQKIATTKFHENLSNGSCIIPIELMDGQTKNEGNSYFLKFCECA
jgi:hypothetical protein